MTAMTIAIVGYVKIKPQQSVKYHIFKQKWLFKSNYFYGTLSS